MFSMKGHLQKLSYIYPCYETLASLADVRMKGHLQKFTLIKYSAIRHLVEFSIAFIR